MPDLARPSVYLDIVEEHFEELDFLWEQREAIIFDPGWNLAELAAHEERADAHLDGLLLAQGHAVDIVRPALAAEERSAAVAAAMTLMAFGSPDLGVQVVAALAAAPEPVKDGIREGLRHSDIGKVSARLQEMATAGEAASRVAAVDVLAFHRQPTPRGIPELMSMVEGRSRSILQTALGRLGGPWSVDATRKGLADPDPLVQRSALETSARLGVPSLASYCRDAARRREDPSPVALAFLGVLGDPEDAKLLVSLLGHAVLAPAALAGLGALGDPATIPQIIEAMKAPELAPAAGAAFVRITGAEGIEADAPLPPPEDMPEEEKEFHEPVVPPDPARAGAWWERTKGAFPAPGRWQSGREIARTGLTEALAPLPLASRRDLYLGRRARDPIGTPDLELERRARLQMQPCRPVAPATGR